MANGEGTPEDAVMSMVDGDLLDELLGTLDGRARYAVEARFGLLDGERKSFREVGESLGVTAEAARRLVQSSRRQPALPRRADPRLLTTAQRGRRSSRLGRPVCGRSARPTEQVARPPHESLSMSLAVPSYRGDRPYHWSQVTSRTRSSGRWSATSEPLHAPHWLGGGCRW